MTVEDISLRRQVNTDLVSLSRRYQAVSMQWLGENIANRARKGREEEGTSVRDRIQIGTRGLASPELWHNAEKCGHSDK